MKKKQRISFEKRKSEYIIYVVLLCIIVASIAMYQNRLTVKTRDEVYTVLSDLAKEKTLALQSRIRGRYMILDSFAKSVSTENIVLDEKMEARINAIYECSDFAYVGVALADGNFLMHNGKRPFCGDREYFKKSMSGEKCVEKLESDKIDGLPRLILSVPIIQNGVTVGVVLGSYDEGGFAELFSMKNYKNSTYAFICDLNGNIIINEKADNTLIERDNIWSVFGEMETLQPNISKIKENFKSAQEGMLLYRYKSNSRLAAYVPLDMENAKWVMFTCIPTDVTKKMVSDNMMLTWMLIVTVIICISGMLLLFIRVKHESRVEVENQKSLMMMSQIKPHFMYNTLGAIESMIFSDAEKARELLLNFSKYLRTNIDFLSNDYLVEFSKELQHVVVYSEIEKSRFGNRVQILYDITEENFPIPPLTVQPIVENAIKHGICKKADGGTVHISSYRENGKYIVTVKDNGIGFDESAQIEKTSIGLKNIAQRLKSMVDGKIYVRSIPGKGTTVTIEIPERSVKRHENDNGR